MFLESGASLSTMETVETESPHACATSSKVTCPDLRAPCVSLTALCPRPPQSTRLNGNGQKSGGLRFPLDTGKLCSYIGSLLFKRLNVNNSVGKCHESGNAQSRIVRKFICFLIFALAAGTAAFARRAGAPSTAWSPTPPEPWSWSQGDGAQSCYAIKTSTVSTAAGLYSFVSLNPGVYEVTASLKGFESVAQDNVKVTVDQVSTVNIALQ